MRWLARRRPLTALAGIIALVALAWLAAPLVLPAGAARDAAPAATTRLATTPQPSIVPTPGAPRQLRAILPSEPVPLLESAADRDAAASETRANLGDVVGRVENADGRPIEGAQVTLSLDGFLFTPAETTPGSVEHREERRPVSWQTDATGAFYFTDRLRVQHELRIAAEGFTPTTRKLMPGGEPVLITLLDEGTLHVAFREAGTGRSKPVWGVTAQGSRATPVDGAGEPIDPPSASFLVHHASPATQRLTVALQPGRPALSVPVRPGVPGRQTSAVVELPELGSLQGRIVDVTGTPIAGARIALIPRHVTGGRELHARTHDVETGADGRFASHGLLPGRWTVAASMDGYVDPLGHGRAVHVGVGVEQLPDITMPFTGRLLGTLRDAAGRPVPRARVWAVPEAHGVTGRADRTNAHGHYLISELAPGAWRMVTRDTQSEPARVYPGSDTFLDLALPE